jgi:putative transposase
MSRGERKAMIRRDHPELSLSRQCRLLSIRRSSFDYTPQGESPENLSVMRRIDELFMKYPFYGSRQMVRQRRREGTEVGRHRVRRLMGLEAIYQAPRTSDPPGAPHPPLPAAGPDDHAAQSSLVHRHHVHPRATWLFVPGSDHGETLSAIGPRTMTRATRHVLAWRLSNTMDVGFCLEALNEALAKYGQPEIFNTDQGSQFTSLAFTDVLKRAGVAISMDGRGRYMDNIFIERLWRSLKYEAVYLHELTDGFVAERVIAEWLDFYNTERPHSSLDGQTPREAYWSGRPMEYDGQG